MNSNNLEPLIIGFISFLFIGLCHPLVIKVEYFYGKKTWPIFFVLGIILTIVSLVIENTIVSIIAGVGAFSLFWSAFELVKQDERVRQGRAKRNPKRIYDES